MIQDLKKQLASEQIGEFFTKMKQLGFQQEETLTLLQESLQEEANQDE